MVSGPTIRLSMDEPEEQSEHSELHCQIARLHGNEQGGIHNRLLRHESQDM